MKKIQQKMFVAVLGATSVCQIVTADIFESISNGKVGVSERIRYETVTDDAFDDKAYALTLRSRLSYETGPFSGFTILAEFEDVQALGHRDDFQLPAPPAPVATGAAVIADPDTTELNRAQLRFRGVPKLDVILGRQRIAYDNQRFIGSVSFRQNEQTFDALSVNYSGVTDWTFNYAHVARVNGIIDSLDADTSDDLLNISYNGWLFGKFIFYSYDLHNQDDSIAGVPATIQLNPGLRFLKNRTSGVRFDGAYVMPTTVPLRAIYRAEYSAQYAETYDLPGIAFEHRARYQLLEGAIAWTFGAGDYLLQPLFGHEVLGSDDSTYGLQTPYATKHAFNGWIDHFLVTPKEGLKDQYLNVAFDVNSMSLKTLFQFHRYRSAEPSLVTSSDLDLGKEISVQVAKAFGPQWGIGLKWSEYQEGDDAPVSRKLDSEKWWLWAELNF